MSLYKVDLDDSKPRSLSQNVTVIICAHKSDFIKRESPALKFLVPSSMTTRREVRSVTKLLARDLFLVLSRIAAFCSRSIIYHSVSTVIKQNISPFTE